MDKIIVQFFFRLILFITPIFILHLAILSFNNLPVYENKIILSYSINTFLAAIIFLFLYAFRKKYKDQLGFLYMGGSLFKFTLFFILFYPAYKTDNIFTLLEFAAFFVPYLTCLLIETLSLIRFLNSSEQNQ